MVRPILVTRFRTVGWNDHLAIPALRSFAIIDHDEMRFQLARLLPLWTSVQRKKSSLFEERVVCKFPEGNTEFTNNPKSSVKGRTGFTKSPRIMGGAEGGRGERKH